LKHLFPIVPERQVPCGAVAIEYWPNQSQIGWTSSKLLTEPPLEDIVRTWCVPLEFVQNIQRVEYWKTHVPLHGALALRVEPLIEGRSYKSTEEAEAHVCNASRIQGPRHGLEEDDSDIEHRLSDLRKDLGMTYDGSEDSQINRDRRDRAVELEDSRNLPKYIEFCEEFQKLEQETADFESSWKGILAENIIKRYNRKGAAPLLLIEALMPRWLNVIESEFTDFDALWTPHNKRERNATMVYLSVTAMIKERRARRIHWVRFLRTGLERIDYALTQDRRVRYMNLVGRALESQFTSHLFDIWGEILEYLDAEFAAIQVACAGGINSNYAATRNANAGNLLNW
jgi:hypothetical protein